MCFPVPQVLACYLRGAGGTVNDPALLLLEDFDRKVYLRCLIAVVKVHGIEPIERDYVNSRAALLGIESEGLWDEPLTEFPELQPGVSEITRRVIVRDCILMGCIDGEYTDDERTWVHRIAEWLEVSTETCDLLEDWLRRYFDLIDEQEALLCGFEPPLDSTAWPDPIPPIHVNLSEDD